MSSARRTWKILAIAATFGIVCLVGAALAIKPLIRRFIESEARGHGVELHVGALDWGLGWVRFSDSSFRLIGVAGLTGTLQVVEVDIERLQPTRIEAKGMKLELVGSVTTLAIELATWTKDHPSIYRLPLSARDVDAIFRTNTNAEPWLELFDGIVIPFKTRGSFAAERARIAGVPAGKFGAEWTREESFVSLGLGTTDLGAAPLTVRVQYALARPTADLTLLPIDLEKLAGPLGVVMPVKGVTASGKAHLVFAPGVGPGRVEGDLSVKLKGFVPPHPRELDGFVFGDVTTVDSKFEINPERTRVELRETRVLAGAFQLKGEGNIVRVLDRARIQLTLRGSLPCGALAGATAESQLGKTIGSWLGRAAKQFLAGSVAVTVRIDASSHDLANARVDRSIGIGCGLKPLAWPDELPDFSKLPPPFPSGLPALPSGFPPMPSSLPAIPSAFRPPKLTFPNFGAPKSKLEQPPPSP